MVDRGSRQRSSGSSRSNRRIQELEERLAAQAKELRYLKDLIGTKDSSVADLSKMIGKTVLLADITQDIHKGELKWVSKWNLGVQVKGSDEVSVFFKGNLVRVTPSRDNR